MSNTTHQINDDVNEVNRLALELERAELGIGCDPVPELQPPHDYFYTAPDGSWHVHPLASAYREARKAQAEHGAPEISAHSIKQRREATERYQRLKNSRDRLRARRLEGDRGGGLRRLIDLGVLTDLALDDLRTIESRVFVTNRTKRVAKRRTKAAELAVGIVRRRRPRVSSEWGQ